MTASKGLLNFESDCLRVLNSASFRNYLFGQSLSSIGTGLQQVALGWYVWRTTHSAWALAVFTAVILAGQFLFSFAGGCLADKHDRCRLLMTVQWGGLCLSALVAALIALNCLPLPIVMCLGLAIGIFVALEYPLRHSLSAELVAQQDRLSARGYYSSACAASIAIGQALGGLIISLLPSVGEALCALLNALSFFLSVLLLKVVIRNREIESDLEQQKKQERESELKSAALSKLDYVLEKTGQNQALGAVSGNWLRRSASLNYVLQCRVILLSFVQTAILVLFGTRYFSLLPAFAAEVYHGGARESGFLTAVFALGFSAGAMLCGAIKDKNRLENVSDLSLLLLPLGLLSFCSFQNFAFALVCVFFMAACQSASINSCICLMQTHAPESFFGRLMGLRISLVAFCDLLAAVVVSLVVQQLGLRATVISAALLCLFAALLVIFRRQLLAGSANLIPVFTSLRRNSGN